MGDKGGKKDKEKSKQQQSKKQDQQAREKQAKARPQTSRKYRISAVGFPNPSIRIAARTSSVPGVLRRATRVHR